MSDEDLMRWQWDEKKKEIMTYNDLYSVKTYERRQKDKFEVMSIASMTAVANKSKP